ncbi:hypothetical protein IQE94_11960 [Synechocystis sp. PCC 7339]|uniref:hypothetical protein n=1 Tax=unclassified Synechocystis TaxID=2640012 RepID=UPI001BAF8B2A|nr:MULTISPECIES: hypothetical protein [unclassified Synechocystis]QUS59639.1 hypothetical protein HTZ78_02385 [Synechocystis sp. PCC 7338]UAJ71840.1 hypothetical protein IQE94_11960 [Synechocystis sp. PCC 7339]
MEAFWVIGLRSCLRLFGAFWIFGGFLTLQAARESLSLDRALEAIALEKQDRLLSYFLFLGGLFTLTTGIGLVLASRLVFIPLTLSVISQLVYFWLQKRRFSRAKTEEEREDAQVQPTTINAFKISCVVAIACGLGWAVGSLK